MKRMDKVVIVVQYGRLSEIVLLKTYYLRFTATANLTNIMFKGMKNAIL